MHLSHQSEGTLRILLVFCLCAFRRVVPSAWNTLPSSQSPLPHPTNTLMEMHCFQVRDAYLYCSTMMHIWQSILISPLKQSLQNSAPGPPPLGCVLTPYSGLDPPPLGVALLWHKHHGGILLWFPLPSLDREQLEANYVLIYSVFSTVPVT